jgi:ABC-2 type transport system permease protein
MKNYFKADLKRIHRKGIHYVLLITFYVILSIVAYVKASSTSSYSSFSELATGALSMFLGILLFFEVFQDDTKTRTMQIAIGRGLTRAEVLFTKELEGLFLTIVYYSIAGVLLSIIPAVMHLSLQDAGVNSFWISVVSSELNTILYFNIGLIIVVATLKSNFAEIVFILFTFDIIPAGINLALGLCNAKLGMPDLLPYVYHNMTDTFVENPLQNWGSCLGIIFYLILSLWIAIRIFNKKELEF